MLKSSIALFIGSTIVSFIIMGLSFLIMQHWGLAWIVS